MIRNYFEVQEQALVEAFQEKLEYAQADSRFEVECTVDETEMARAARVQCSQFGQDLLKGTPRG